jgi:hypothetical protein
VRGTCPYVPVPIQPGADDDICRPLDIRENLRFRRCLLLYKTNEVCLQPPRRFTIASIVIGHVKAGSGKSYDVKWDQSSHDIYVSWAGWSHVGRADSPSEAMVKAEAWLYDK